MQGKSLVRRSRVGSEPTLHADEAEDGDEEEDEDL